MAEWTTEAAGRITSDEFVREGQRLMCDTCSEDEGDPMGDYCCQCCNERDRQPGTYITVRLDGDPAIGPSRVVVFMEGALAAHDAEVAANALEDAADDPRMRSVGHSGVGVQKLRARAAALRKG